MDRANCSIIWLRENIPYVRERLKTRVKKKQNRTELVFCGHRRGNLQRILPNGDIEFVDNKGAAFARIWSADTDKVTGGDRYDLS